jgi:putative membrane protein
LRWERAGQLRPRTTPSIAMSVDAQAVLHSWQVPLGVSFALGLVLLVYLRGWLRLRVLFRDLILIRSLAAFSAGIGCIWIATASPLAAFDEASLSVHMVQHILLMTIGPALTLLGAPALPFLHGLPRPLSRNLISPFLRLVWVKSAGRFLTHPAFCWLAAAISLLIWHVPAVFELALRSDWIHKLEHASFLGVGLLFWWPVLQPWPSTARWPRWSIPLYLFFATFPCDLLSGFLAFCDRVVYSSYLSAPHVFHLSPLEDQQCAAALMWFAVTIIFLIPAVGVSVQILSPRPPLLQHTRRHIGTIPAQHLDDSKLEVI